MAGRRKPAGVRRFGQTFRFVSPRRTVVYPKGHLVDGLPADVIASAEAAGALIEEATGEAAPDGEG